MKDDTTFEENNLDTRKNQVYGIRSGTKDSGKAYEKHLIALYAVRGVNCQTEDFWIATNVEECGDFDDVVIYRKDKQSGTEEMFLLQCKHSESPKVIPVTKFFKPIRSKSNQKDYALERYSISYKTSIKSASTNPKLYIYNKMQELKENLSCVLFTNNSIDMNCHPILENTQQEFLNTQGSVYRFKPDDIQEINSKKQLHLDLDSQFLEKLVLLTDQVHNDKIYSFITNEINKLLLPTKISDSNLNEVVKKYICFITEWAQGDLGNHYLLTKSHITTKLTELFLESYMSQFYKNSLVNITSPYNLNKWHHLVHIKSVTLIDMNFDENDSTVVNFLHQYLYEKVNRHAQLNKALNSDWEQKFTEENQNKFYRTNDEALKNEMLRTVGSIGSVTMLHLYKALWKLERLPLVLEVNTIEDFKVVHEILRFSQFRFKTVVLNKSNSVLCHVNPIEEVLSSAHDLDELTKEIIFENLIKFQGKTIQLEKLFTLHKPLSRLITTRHIINILTSIKVFNIGNTFKELPKYFIPRTIPRIMINTSKLVRALDKSKDVIALQCASKDFFLKLLKSLNLHMPDSCVSEYSAVRKDIEDGLDIASYKVIIVNNSTTIEDVLKKYPSGKNFHYLTYNLVNSLEWIKTIGSIKTILSCKLDLESNSNSPLSVERALKYFSNQINVITAKAGMGKSTIMNFISYNTPINTWTLQIDLNQHLDYYGSEKFKESLLNPEKHLEYFNNYVLEKQRINSTLNKETFAYFLKSQSILVLLDGFDEISPYNKEEVTEMIKSLLKANYRIWLTTRPALKLHVEKKFNTVALSLSRLSEADQIEFLRKYFMEALNSEDTENKIREFVLQLLDLTKTKLNDWEHEFTSVPLQTMMLADAFVNSCRNYIEKHDSFNLNESFDLLFLYENFTRRKTQIFAKKYGNHIKQMSQLLETYQQLCALQIVFPESDLQELQINELLSTYFNMIHDIEELAQKDGIIVTEKPLNLAFTHRTYAEYFSALWLSRNFEKPPVKKLIKRLFEENYTITRNMFDRILAKEQPLHILIINGQLEKADHLIKIKTNSEILNDRDKGGRLACHLAASWGIRHPLLDFDELAFPDFHRIKTNGGKIKMSDILTSMCSTIETLPKDTIMELTPLDYAISTNSLANINALVANLKMPATLSEERTKCHYAYYCGRYGYSSLAKEIKSAMSTNEVLDIDENTLLHLGAMFGHKEIVALVISKGAHIDAKNTNSSTALLLATQNGYSDIVKLLLSNGANVQAKDQNKKTVLHLAIEDKAPLEGVSPKLINEDNMTTIKKLNILSLLLSSGADVNAMDEDNMTVLHHAVTNGSLDIVSLLISKYANINATGGQHEETPLHMAVRGPWYDIASLLLSRGALTDSQDKWDMTVLHAAAESASVDMVALLLSNKANPYLKDKNLMTPLHHAVISSSLEITELLLYEIENNKEVNVSNYINESDREKMTVLHHATRKNLIGLTLLLLDKGADPNKKDISYHKPLYYAIQKRHEKLVKILEDKTDDC